MMENGFDVAERKGVDSPDWLFRKSIGPFSLSTSWPFGDLAECVPKCRRGSDFGHFGV